MRTKALLGLAVLAVSAATCVAQNVYSLNIVGYVNKDVTAKNYYLLENPLTKGTAALANAVSNVISLNDTFGNSILYTYDNGALVAAETYFTGFGWFPGNTELTPGKAFYFYPEGSGTVTFVGEVVLTNTISLKPGFNMVSSAFPAAMTLKDLGLNGQETDLSDIVYRFNAGAFTLITYFKGYGWYDASVTTPPGGDPKGPVLNVGEGIWYYNANPAAVDWKQAFTVQ